MTGSAVAVLTVTHNSSEVIEGFLDSIPAAYSGDVRVIAVDSGSSPAELEIARDAVDRRGGIFSPLPRNGGYGTGINAAARLARDASYVLISNPDIVLEPGSIDALVAAVDVDASIGAVGPRILNLDGSVYPSARRLPSTALGIGHALFANVWRTNPWSARYHNADLPSDRPTDVGWLSGACLLMRTDDFRRFGGFDERFFMYFEDVDLGRRIGLASRRNVYVPTATVRHVGGHSTTGSSRIMLAAHHRSAARYFAVRHPEWYWFPARLIVHVGLAVRNLVAVASGSRRNG